MEFLKKIYTKNLKLVMKYFKPFKQFLNDKNISESTLDDPKKANLASKDVEDFFSTLESASEAGGIVEEVLGKMEFKKSVESLQIGLLLLGYDLPNFGVDGLFGPETAKAVRQFKIDNNLLKESQEFVELKSTNYPNIKFDKDETQFDMVNKDLLDDLQKAAQSSSIIITITCAKSGHPSDTNPTNRSRHRFGAAVDISILNGIGSGGSRDESSGNQKFRELGNRLKDELVKLGYKPNQENPSESKSVLWQTNIGGNHFNHLHVSNTSGLSSSELETRSLMSMSPKELRFFISKLKERGVTSEDLQRYIDVELGGSIRFTRLDLKNEQDLATYARICQDYIVSRGPNPLNITGEMMANSAKRAFDKWSQYVPPELALSQLVLEGGIGNPDLETRPIRTKNPFNVGNTDSGQNINMSTVSEGIDRYFDLMCTMYLVGGKTPEDLVRNFKNKRGSRYASSETYEKNLRRIIPEVNRISNLVLSQTKVKPLVS